MSGFPGFQNVHRSISNLNNPFLRALLQKMMTPPPPVDPHLLAAAGGMTWQEQNRQNERDQIMRELLNTRQLPQLDPTSAGDLWRENMAQNSALQMQFDRDKSAAMGTILGQGLDNSSIAADILGRLSYGQQALKAQLEGQQAERRAALRQQLLADRMQALQQAAGLLGNPVTGNADAMALIQQQMANAAAAREGAIQALSRLASNWSDAPSLFSRGAAPSDVSWGATRRSPHANPLWAGTANVGDPSWDWHGNPLYPEMVQRLVMSSGKAGSGGHNMSDFYTKSEQDK